MNARQAYENVRRLSSFQSALLEDMESGKWYSVYPAEGYEAFPGWFYRQQSRPQVTLRAMVDSGAIIRKRVQRGSWSFPIYRKT